MGSGFWVLEGGVLTDDSAIVNVQARRSRPEAPPTFKNSGLQIPAGEEEEADESLSVLVDVDVARPGVDRAFGGVVRISDAQIRVRIVEDEATFVIKGHLQIERISGPQTAAHVYYLQD